MQTNLRQRSLDQRRADARLCMLYTIMHGLVAIQLPSYFLRPSRMTRHSHPLALRQFLLQILISTLAVVQWNKLPAGVVMLPTLPQFSVVVRSFDHQLPQMAYMYQVPIANTDVYKCSFFPQTMRGARWFSGRVSDSGTRGRGFETYRRRVVSLSKTLYSPKVLVNYPGSGCSVPT